MPGPASPLLPWLSWPGADPSELVVDLLLGLGVFVLGGLRVALKSLDDLIARAGVLGFQGGIVGLVLGGELLGQGAVLGLFPFDPFPKPQLGFGFGLGAIAIRASRSDSATVSF